MLLIGGWRVDVGDPVSNRTPQSSFATCITVITCLSSYVRALPVVVVSTSTCTVVLSLERIIYRTLMWADECRFLGEKHRRAHASCLALELIVLTCSSEEELQGRADRTWFYITYTHTIYSKQRRAARIAIHWLEARRITSTISFVPLSFTSACRRWGTSSRPRRP